MHALLAQLPLAGDGAGPPPLPGAPWYVHYTVESPWMGAVCLVAAGLAGAYALNRRARARLGAGALAAGVVLAVILVVAAGLVTTQRERVIARTRELVSLATKADTTGLGPLLAQSVKMRFVLFDHALGRDEILDKVRQFPGGSYPIDSYSIPEVQASIDGPNAARSRLRVTVHSRDATMYDVPVGSWWIIQWRLDDGVWRADGLECWSIDGVAGGR